MRTSEGAWWGARIAWLALVALLVAAPGEAAVPQDSIPLVRPGDGTVLGSRIPEYASGWRVERVNPEGAAVELSVWADTVRVGERDGRETLVRVQHIHPRQGPASVLVNEVDRETLAPIRTTAARGGGEPFVDLRFDGRRVSGRRPVTPANGGAADQVPVEMTLVLPDPIFDWRLWGLFVAAMPLEAGYRARFLAYASEFPVGSPLLLVGVHVVGEEEVETAAGPVLCHLVEVAAGVPWTLWIRKEPGGGPVVQIRIEQFDGNVLWWRPLMGPTGPPPESVVGLDRLRADWTAAYETGDAEAMVELYVENAVRMPYDAPAVEGREAIVAAYRASFAGRRLFPEIDLVALDVEVLGDTAIERGSYHEVLTSRDGATRIVENGKYVSVARRGADDRWRYAISIFNRDAAPGS